MQIPEQIKSRKLWASIVALLFVFVGSRAGLDEQAVQNAVYVLIAYILGVGLEGAKKEVK